MKDVTKPSQSTIEVADLPRSRTYRLCGTRGHVTSSRLKLPSEVESQPVSNLELNFCQSIADRDSYSAIVKTTTHIISPIGSKGRFMPLST